MRTDKLTGWLFRLNAERFFDALSGINCAEMDGIVHARMLGDAKQKATLSASAKNRPKRNK
ncbi:hypothetical protein RMS96_004527 [Enterobacter kobei]|nr:hypothetical protein [Enterobacter kobei]